MIMQDHILTATSLYEKVFLRQSFFNQRHFIKKLGEYLLSALKMQCLYLFNVEALKEINGIKIFN